jgi:simple sugar transport system ATP-binding protein
MLLTIRSLTKTFPGTKALDNVDFDLAAGEVHALLGENGAGKSTLIKCLTGAYRRDAGEVRLEGQLISPGSTSEAQELGIGTVYQEVNLLPNLTVAQNLTFGREPRRLGLVDQRAQRHAAQEMLTASLDAAEVRMLFDVVRRLRDRGLGIVFVSHFLDQVFELTDRLTVLRNGQHVVTAETDGLDRLGLIQHMLGRELEAVASQGHAAAADVDKPEMLQFTGMGRAGVIDPFDLSVREGEVIGFAGLLGSGRTESAELLFGLRRAQSGVARDTKGPIAIDTPRDAIAAGFGFAPEDRKTDGIVADLSIRENIILALQARRGWARPLPRAEQDRLAAQYIKSLDIRTSDAEKAIGDLSGGNQQKVVLARWLAMNPRFLILDEPTRGIDVGAHAEILKLIGKLTEGGMSVLIISSELDELVVAADRIIVVRDRRHVCELGGDAVSADTILKAIADADLLPASEVAQ